MNTYRDIAKWGDKHEETLDQGTLRVLAQAFGLTAQELEPHHLLGNEALAPLPPSGLSPEQIEYLRHLLGPEGLATDDTTRAHHAYGKYYTELLKLRLGQLPNPPCAVAYPETEEQIVALVRWCVQAGVPLTPVGAASSVTGGVATTHRGMVLDLSKRYNKLLRVQPTNHTYTVQAGILGPELEARLNAQGFSCGHFPQSFEYSTAGGWVAARGAGQASTGYGKIEDLVLAMRVATPVGLVETKAYPKMAQAWNLNELFVGSEGTLGVITELTLRMVPYRPQNRSYAAFLFRNFEQATTAMRQMIQAEYGRPHLFRLSDPRETDVAFRIKNFDGSLADKLLQRFGYRPLQRCLMFVAVEGDRDYTRFVKRKLRQTAKANGAFYLGQKPTRKWLEQRYHSAYLRDPLMDRAIITDTLETAVAWDRLVPLWAAVQEYMNARPRTVVMTHLSHIYETGANLYFTFLSPMQKGNELEDYQQFHRGIVERIVANGGSLSHHHGVGRVLVPWLHTQYGPDTLAVLQGIKSVLDPRGLMNPGALGFEPSR